MTAEDRIKGLIGDLHFQLAFLVTEAEKIKKELDDLKAKESAPADTSSTGKFEPQ